MLTFMNSIKEYHGFEPQALFFAHEQSLEWVRNISGKRKIGDIPMQ